MRQFSPAEKFAAQELARADLYFFSRWMFHERRGYKWLRSPHHKTICDALMRVFAGECKRLIINIPPRYSKTELAVVNFVAWAFGHAPDAEFIHASYSGTLAINNSAAVRGVVQHEAYTEIFPGMTLATDAKAHWVTGAGGVMYATGTGGTITGFGAGKHREGFGGCFPYAQLVETEIGPVAIGDLVTRQMPVRVWSFNESTGKRELRPVDTFWTNPENQILEIGLENGSAFQCTPNHKILTNSGWIEAGQLANSLDLVNGQAGFFAGLLSSFSSIKRNAANFLRVFGLVVPFRIGQVSSDARPCFSGLDLADYASTNPEFFGDGGGACFAGENGAGHFPCELGARSTLKKREGSVSNGVLHVFGLSAPCKIPNPVVSWVSIQMSRLVSIGVRAGKALKNKVRDISKRYLAVNRKVDPKVSLAVIASLDGAQWGGASYVSDDGDLVEAGGVGYVNPVFVRDAGHVDVTFCLEVRGNHNFILAQSGAIVSNCIIIDDPHKADEARSDVMRQNVIDWFQNTLESRKNSPETPIIVIMQRLHQDDLAGWLAGGGNGEKWEMVCLPAIQTDGSALWPEKHDIETLRRMEQAAPYVFAGQYQQRPAPAEGGIFKPDQLRVVDAMPAGSIQWVRGWDLASTTNGDWTAGAKLGRLPDGRLIIADMVRLRAGPDERDAAIVNTAAADGRAVKVGIPQDPGQAGKTQVLYLTRSLVGHRVVSSPESGDKVTRAEPLAAQINIGNVLMLRGEFNRQLVEELRMFPNGSNDDQVDSLSRAFAELIGKVPMRISPELLNRTT